MSTSIQTDVLIVGLGPVGAALANLLGRYGIRVTAIDKSTEIFNAPRAIALDNEALRILQMCGLEEGAFETVAIPEVRMHSPAFGQYSRAVTAGAIDGHPKLVTFYQPELEQVLRQRLNQYPHVTVQLGVALQSFQQQDTHVQAVLQDSQGHAIQVSVRYLVGADGASSLVRQALGQDFKGKTYAEDWLVVDAKNAAKAIDHVEFICDPKRPTPHMVAPGGRQRWEFKLQAGETREQMEHPDTVKRLLAPWATPGQDIEIERVAVYRFHARVADRFQVGRAFLVGDAAHITPPFVGQGLVAGLRDVANLGWKLAWVVQGLADPELLASYTQERQPHVRAMIDLAKWMGRLVMPSNGITAFVTHGVMKTLGHIPKLRRLFEHLEIKPANRFKQGCFVPPGANSVLTRGGQAPQTWVRRQASSPTQTTTALSDDVLGTGFAMIGFGVCPRSNLTATERARWEHLGGRFLQIDPRGRPATSPPGDAWEDIGGSLLPHPLPHGWVAIVRPDKVVMHDGPATDSAAILNLAIHELKPIAAH